MEHSTVCELAQALAESDPGACVLLCCVELCSLHHQYTSDVQQIVANALFSDGAGAVVGEAASAANGEAWQVVDQQTYLVPDSRELMSWRIFDHGFQMTLSPRVPEAIRESLRPWLSGWLAGQGLEIADIRSWAIHPGGPKILAACANAIGLRDATDEPFATGARGIWQHVVADRALHPRTDSSASRFAAMCDAGLWARHDDRGSVVAIVRELPPSSGSRDFAPRNRLLALRCR